MKIAVYEQRDGVAYDSFYKSTEAGLEYTHNGITANHVITRVRKLTTTRDYYTQATPCNVNKLTHKQLAAIVTRLESFNGVRMPLYQLDTRAYAIARLVGVIE